MRIGRDVAYFSCFHCRVFVASRRRLHSHEKIRTLFFFFSVPFAPFFFYRLLRKLGYITYSPKVRERMCVEGRRQVKKKKGYVFQMRKALFISSVPIDQRSRRNFWKRASLDWTNILKGPCLVACQHRTYISPPLECVCARARACMYVY